MKRCYFILLILLVASQAVIANDDDSNDSNEQLLAKWDTIIKDMNDPNELLQAMRDAVVDILQTKDIDQELKDKIIEKIISLVFDFPLMSKLSLGREHWPKLTLSQREKFTSLFVERLKASCREKIALFNGEKVLLKPAVRKKRTIHLPMVLISAEKKITILYKFRGVDKCWKIYDVEIQGVSIILTYRSQFDDTLSHGTVEDLFAQLEKPPTS